MVEFDRKMELGSFIRKFVDDNNLNEKGLSRDKQEALEIYDKFGKNMNKKEVKWYGWQQKLRGYLNEKSEREVFWIVGRDGNEGKTFFKKIYM